MLIVDASCLFEVVTATRLAEPIRRRLELDPEQAAPHVVDVEVVGAIRRHLLLGELDETTAALGVAQLSAWTGTRHGHRPLLDRVWELRSSVRSWDAFYVALAESLDATLLTRDGRLARAPGPRCPIDLVG